MALDRLIRLAVAMANRQTEDVQPLVTHSRVRLEADGSVVQDGFGNREYEPGEEVPALVEDEQRPIRTEDGTKRQVEARVTFFEPRKVDSEDRITLPDGRTGPLLRIKALLDKDGNPYMTEVWMGSPVGVRRS